MDLTDVLVVPDDAQALRRHVHAVLDDPTLRLVAAVRGEPATRALLDAATPDVLLIDPGRCAFDGIERLVRHAARRHPCCSVLVVMRSGGDDERDMAVLAAGASGCLPRDASGRIAAGIHEAHLEGSRSCLAVRGRLLPRLPRTPDAQSAAPARLTARETEILRLIEKGLGFGTVGYLLEISPHTVVAHLRKIYTKLAVHSRGEAVHEARQMGLPGNTGREGNTGSSHERGMAKRDRVIGSDAGLF